MFTMHTSCLHMAIPAVFQTVACGQCSMWQENMVYVYKILQGAMRMRAASSGDDRDI